MRAVILPCVVMVGISACKKPKEPRDPTIHWTGTVFRVDDHPLGEVQSRDGEINIDLDIRLLVSSVELGEPPVKASGWIPVWDHLGDAQLAQGSKTEIDLQLPMKVNWNQVTEPSLTKIGKVVFGLEDPTAAFSEIEKRGLKFTGTDTQNPGPKTIALRFQGSKGAIVGPGKRLRDIDLVGVVRSAETATMLHCTYERIGKRTVSFYDAEVTVHDRRTGAVVDTVKISPPRACPDSLEQTTSDTGPTTVSGDDVRPSDQAIVEWFETHPRT